MNTPDLIQRVVGMRAWAIYKDELGLFSSVAVGRIRDSNRIPWSRGVNTAVCHDSYMPAFRNLLSYPTDHDDISPDSQCHCGLYALHPDRNIDGKVTGVGRNLINEANSTMRNSTYDYYALIGVISAWGAIEVNVDGFRSQYARIECLSIHPNANGMIDKRFSDDPYMISTEVFSAPAWFNSAVIRECKNYDVPFVPFNDIAEFIPTVGAEVPMSLRPNELPSPSRSKGFPNWWNSSHTANTANWLNANTTSFMRSSTNIRRIDPPTTYIKIDPTS